MKGSSVSWAFALLLAVLCRAHVDLFSPSSEAMGVISSFLGQIHHSPLAVCLDGDRLALEPDVLYKALQPPKAPKPQTALAGGSTMMQKYLKHHARNQQVRTQLERQIAVHLAIRTSVAAFGGTPAHKEVLRKLLQFCLVQMDTSAYQRTWEARPRAGGELMRSLQLTLVAQAKLTFAHVRDLLLMAGNACNTCRKIVLSSYQVPLLPAGKAAEAASYPLMQGETRCRALLPVLAEGSVEKDIQARLCTPEVVRNIQSFFAADRLAAPVSDGAVQVATHRPIAGLCCGSRLRDCLGEGIASMIKAPFCSEVEERDAQWLCGSDPEDRRNCVKLNVWRVTARPKQADGGKLLGELELAGRNGGNFFSVASMARPQTFLNRFFVVVDKRLIDNYVPLDENEMTKNGVGATSPSKEPRECLPGLLAAGAAKFFGGLVPAEVPLSEEQRVLAWLSFPLWSEMSAWEVVKHQRKLILDAIPDEDVARQSLLALFETA